MFKKVVSCYLQRLSFLYSSLPTFFAMTINFSLLLRILCPESLFSSLCLAPKCKTSLLIPLPFVLVIPYIFHPPNRGYLRERQSTILLFLRSLPPLQSFPSSTLFTCDFPKKCDTLLVLSCFSLYHSSIHTFSFKVLEPISASVFGHFIAANALVSNSICLSPGNLFLADIRLAC